MKTSGVVSLEKRPRGTLVSEGRTLVGVGWLAMKRDHARFTQRRQSIRRRNLKKKHTNTKHKTQLTNFGTKKNSQKTLQNQKQQQNLPGPTSFHSKTLRDLRHLASAWPIAVGVVSSRPLPRRCIRWVPGYAGAGAGDLRALWRETWRWSSRPVFYQTRA